MPSSSTTGGAGCSSVSELSSALRPKSGGSPEPRARASPSRMVRAHPRVPVACASRVREAHVDIAPTRERQDDAIAPASFSVFGKCSKATTLGVSKSAGDLGGALPDADELAVLSVADGHHRRRSAEIDGDPCVAHVDLRIAPHDLRRHHLAVARALVQAHHLALAQDGDAPRTHEARALPKATPRIGQDRAGIGSRPATTVGK